MRGTSMGWAELEKMSGPLIERGVLEGTMNEMGSLMELLDEKLVVFPQDSGENVLVWMEIHYDDVVGEEFWEELIHVMKWALAPRKVWKM
jgi:hypothetical protein